MIQVDRVRCCYCGGCVSICPVHVLHLAETRLLVGEGCIACGLCLSTCPAGALSEADGPSPVAHSWGSGRAPSQQSATPGDRYDVAVVGAGPGGSVAAWRAAQAGLSVLLLEKRQPQLCQALCRRGRWQVKSRPPTQPNHPD